MLSAFLFKSEFFAGNFAGNFEQTPLTQDGFFSLPFLGHAFKEKEGNFVIIRPQRGRIAKSRLQNAILEPSIATMSSKIG